MNSDQPPQESHTKIDPNLQDDPDIIAEKKKRVLWKMRWDRYTQVSNALGVILHNFRAEALSLVSGAGTLVLGWYQIKKWILEGRDFDTAKPYGEEEAKEADGGTIGTGDPATIGHGAGGVSNAARRAPASEAPVASAPGSEIVVMAPRHDIPTMMTDPYTYIWVGLIGTFVWSSMKAWLKKKNKLKEKIKSAL